jgi:uncharacterized protein
MEKFEQLFEDYMSRLCQENPDPSHDILHVSRVVSLAKKIANLERADFRIVVPAAYLHDCVYISKTDMRRTQASRISADKAMMLLTDWNYPKEFLPAVHHAIAAHSFSAGIVAETIEAKVVQDADRLDAMGATGIFRCFAFSGLSKRPLCRATDPFSKNRNPDDSDNTLDHFFMKLLHLQDRLNTKSGKTEGALRFQTMNNFLMSLERELEGASTGRDDQNSKAPLDGGFKNLFPA